MWIVAISVIYPSSSEFIFTKATKCVVQIDLLLEKKWQAFFISDKNVDTKTNPDEPVDKLTHI